jgi:7,8-dihydropterin-6-yl-methyl-4-(beta-D-ribofuranosyl)aminobenzene 5'-phosphate synthase
VAAPGLLGEHGFAAYVETPDGNILFDTGQGFGLIDNSLRLKKDLRRVSQLVLSHGHFDHTGGLIKFLDCHGPCDVVAHPDVLSERFWRIGGPDGTQPLSVGIPWQESHLTTRGARFQWRTAFAEIAPNVFITGEVSRRTAFETGDARMVVNHDGNWVQDPLLDDYSLVLKTRQGLVIVLGCAHAGVINILQHVIEQTGEDRIHAILGGTHLGLLSNPGLLETTISALKEYRIGLLAVSHCTGQLPAARLCAEFGESFAFGQVGFTLSVAD